MASRSRRRDDDDYDDDDRPRRRRDYDDDDDDDRPRSRRHRDDDDDDYDDRPRRRRRDDYDDEPRRRPRRKGSKSNAGLIVGIVLGVLGLIGVGVAVYLLAGGGRADISYDKFQAITEDDTIEGLEKRFGSATKIGPRDWNRTYVGGSDRPLGVDGPQSSPISHYNSFARDVTAWYAWRRGKEELYVAEGTDFQGRKGLVVKVYLNPKVLEDAVRDPKGPRPATPWWHVRAIGGPGEIRFGGGP